MLAQVCAGTDVRYPLSITQSLVAIIASFILTNSFDVGCENFHIPVDVSIAKP